MDRPLSLAERRSRLIDRIATQRRAIGAAVEPWRRPLAVADRGIEAVRFVKAHPVWIVGTAMAPGSFRIGAWMRRGLAAFQVVRRLRGRT